jgi:hypothetical protein
MPSASSASSSDKSIAVLIKKAMAKMPVSLNTKKGIDEYYKNAMKEIVLKIKATEKAAKAKKVEKVAKKRGGGDDDDKIIRDIIKYYFFAKKTVNGEIIDADGNVYVGDKRFETTTRIRKYNFFKSHISNIIENFKKLKVDNDIIENIEYNNEILNSSETPENIERVNNIILKISGVMGRFIEINGKYMSPF